MGGGTHQVQRVEKGKEKEEQEKKINIQKKVLYEQ